MRKNIAAVLLTVLLLGIGVSFIFPFLFMLSSSFKPLGEIMVYPIKYIPRNPTFQNYHTVFFTPLLNFGRWYINTLVMEAHILVLKTIVVTLTGYAFAKIKFFARDVIFLVLLSALMIPSDIMIIPRYIIFSRIHIIDTHWSMIFPYMFDIYFVFLIRQFFITIPESLTEAAEIDGCNHFMIYSRIIIPLSMPAVLTMILFTFVWAWNDYMMPYIFINSVDKQMLSVGMNLFAVGIRQDYGAQLAAATIILIPIFVVFLFSQKYFVEGIATSGMKG
ncbi:MAG: carbohydrate ABC transporter permease [Treponema sp.]|jgi:multiple sugar transport system permease protein|nr:carbohydrate ABC transporter permease [Treponema sp.]